MKTYHYSTISADPVEGLPGVAMRWAIGENVGAPNFVMRVIDIRDAGGETPIGPGSCVYVEPNEIHQFINTGGSVLRIICVIPYPPED